MFAFQVAATVQSDFLVHQGSVYKLSPPYSIKVVSPDERYILSDDGKRLAFISDVKAATPSVLEQDIAKTGKRATDVIKVGVWIRETGQVRYVLTPKSAQLGVDDCQFVGNDLVFTTFDQTEQGSVHRVWVSRNGAVAEAFDLAGYYGGGHVIAARGRQGFVLAAPQGAWLFTAKGHAKLETPGYVSFRSQGLQKDGRAAVFAMRDNGTSDVLLIDFESGAIAKISSDDYQVSEATDELPVFMRDAYKLAGVKDNSYSEDERGSGVDAKPSAIAEEDGGWLVDLVETKGEKRRRVRLASDAARDMQWTPDGLTYAYISNGVLTVRGLVKLTPEAATKYLPKARDHGVDNLEERRAWQ